MSQQSESSTGKVPEELRVLSLCWNLEEGGFGTSYSNRLDELASKVRAGRQAIAVSFFQSFYLSCQWVWPRCRLSVPA